MIGARLRSWFTPESRAAGDYTAQVINQLHTAASGIGSIRQSAVYASCLHLIESSSSSAELEGQHSATLQPRLGAIVKEMVDSGSASYELVIGGGGRLELLPVQIVDVFGGVAEETWLYKIERPGPRSTETTIRPQESVLNFRLRAPARAPWKGSPALPAGNTTANLMGKMETQLTSEAAMRPARVLGAGFSKEQRTDVAAGLKAAGIVVFPLGRTGSDTRAVHAGSIGGEYSAAQVDLFGQVGAMICTVLGCPPDLILGGGADTSSKESFRRFALSTIGPMLQIVMAEWTRLVGEMTFDLDRLRAADAVSISRAIGSRAKAVQSLVQSGMDLPEALSVVGID